MTGPELVLVIMFLAGFFAGFAAGFAAAGFMRE